MAIMTQTI